MHRPTRRLFTLVAAFLAAPFFARAEDLGLFSSHTDIGEIKHPGTAAYDAAKATYTIGGSGANMWFKQDAFHYVWKKVSGDVALAATIDFVGTGREPHRKALLMIRQTLDADSPYADVALHADGLTSLQFRDEKGDITREVQTHLANPRRIRIEKIGDSAYMSLAGADGSLAPTGCSVRLPFSGEFYLGLGVCAHNADELETIAFSQVEITPPSKETAAVRSIIETIPIPAGDRRALYHTNDLIEAPNWSRDGAALVFNGNGRIYRLLLGTLADGKLTLAGDGQPQAIDTGEHGKCNNDHGLSPDGTLLAISDQTKDGKSRIYVLPATGGTPKEITPNAPSYWHGWSPDGQTLAYCAQRDGKFGIFTIPVSGGGEKRITITDGLDDGPDYSADGSWIYFNSDRTGRMQIWRMHSDGSAMEQVTNDDYNNWFAHPSPDGKWIVFLSYAGDVKGHPRDKDVMLRLMSVTPPPAPAEAAPATPNTVSTTLKPFGEPTVIVKLFGGQGTINVPSWSPDSTRIAYVRYQPEQK